MKPPIKAIEQIHNYCVKTQCRRCEFGVREVRYNEGIDYVDCYLQHYNPCDWEIEEKQNDRDVQIVKDRPKN